MTIDTLKAFLNRSSRIEVEGDALLMRGEFSWLTAVENLSATGVLIRRPLGWNADIGNEFLLDMMLNGRYICLRAATVRVTRSHIGLVFSNIGEANEQPLWTLLGSHADSYK